MLLHGFGAMRGRSNKHHGHLPISPLGMGKKERDLGLGFMILGLPGPDSALMGPPGLAIFPIRNKEKCYRVDLGRFGGVAVSVMEIS